MTSPRSRRDRAQHRVARASEQRAEPGSPQGSSGAVPPRGRRRPGRSAGHGRLAPGHRGLDNPTWVGVRPAPRPARGASAVARARPASPGCSWAELAPTGCVPRPRGNRRRNVRLGPMQ